MQLPSICNRNEIENKYEPVSQLYTFLNLFQIENDFHHIPEYIQETSKSPPNIMITHQSREENTIGLIIPSDGLQRSVP